MSSGDMKLLFFTSIRAKLMLSMLAIAVFVIAAISISLIKSQREMSFQHAKDILSVLSNAIAINSESAMIFDDPISANETLATFKVESDIVHACLIGSDGNIFTSYQSLNADYPMPDHHNHLSLLSSIKLKEAKMILEDDLLHSYTPLFFEGKTIGVLHVLDDLDRMSHQRKQFYELVMVISLIAFIISFFLMLGLQNRFLTPLTQLLAVIKSIISQKSYTHRAKVISNDEFGVLASTFNNMLTIVEHRGLKLEQANTSLKHEVDERKKIADKLRLSSRVFSDSLEGVTIIDADRNIVDVNPAFCNITGYSLEEVVGKTPIMLSSGKQQPKFYIDMWNTVDKKGHWQGEVWNRRRNGELYAELLTMSSLLDDTGTIINYVGVFTDITHTKQQQEKLARMAHYDNLTNLPNRALFSDRFDLAIAHSIRNKSKLAVCFIDLDNFKPVNDDFGHDTGDKLLIEVASRIKASIRQEDTVSRQGGDEFALLLNDISSLSDCNKIMSNIHRVLAESYRINNYLHNITVSSGFTLYPDDNADIDTLLRHADQAMYASKVAGKNCYSTFNAERDQEAVNRHTKLIEIEQALLNDELVLYYQPKVNMVTGKVFGAEALIRWIHPEKGIIPPLDFLPILERSELEIQVGYWVIAKGLAQIEIWKSMGIDIEVSVNVSSNHLQDSTFFEQLTSILDKHPSVKANNLQLEILESSALGDLDAIIKVIGSCTTILGVGIALDDFGTSYSSLTHLRNLPASIIKIDQSFVRDMLDDPNDSAIIDGVIGLAHSFNRDVIAEGVESTNHGLMLQMMGCDKAQGYAIAKPMTSGDFVHWFNDYSPNQEWLKNGKKKRTERENRIKLFRVVSEQWKQKFTLNIEADSGSTLLWPILDRKSCHCGVWLHRAETESFFDTNSINRLLEAHSKLHDLANTLQLMHIKGDIISARQGLKALYRIFDKMSLALAESE
jgi:diguanylate cyclase (GGDEF)-like protein/PAS domain S-box-containing protein